MKDRFRRGGGITAPMDPLLPLLETMEEPHPPVTGQLPRCPAAPRASLVPESDPDGLWWILPVDGSGWFDDLAGALSEWAAAADDGDFYSACRGIPLAAIPADGNDPTTIGMDIAAAAVTGKPRPTPGWRALTLQCHEIQWTGFGPWYTELRWRHVWTRRLSRAPAPDSTAIQTNISKQT